MNFQNDDDIKIATNLKKETTDNSEQIAIAFNLQMQAGNINKAKILGTTLGSDIIKKFLNLPYTQQKLILIKFCLTNFLTVSLEDETLTHIAIDELDSMLSKFTGCPQNDNLTGEMYSIFLIASNEKINVAQHIAKAYSQFCSKLDNNNHNDEAMKIYNECELLTKQRIQELNFVKVNFI